MADSTAALILQPDATLHATTLRIADHVIDACLYVAVLDPTSLCVALSSTRLTRRPTTILIPSVAYIVLQLEIIS